MIPVRFFLFGGSASRSLAAATAADLGVSLGACRVGRFPDGEHDVAILEDVRNADVYLIQSLAPPAGESLLELLLLGDACRRAGAARMTAVVPYLAYARQDRRRAGNEPLGARLVAELIERAGFARIIVVDLHSPSAESAFGIPVVHLSAVPALARHLAPPAKNAIVVSPDLGGIKRAESYARLLDLPVAVVHKSRRSGLEVAALGVVGDVRGRAPIVVDDIISTGGTIAAAANLLVQAGCEPEITVVATHGLFVGPAPERLGRAPVRRIVVTDSLAGPDLALRREIVSVGGILAAAIREQHRPLGGLPRGGVELSGR